MLTVRMRPGPVYMVGAALAFTVMMALVKVVSAEMSALDTLVWRSALAVPVGFAFAWRSGMRVHSHKLLAVRTVFGFASMVSMYTALSGLSLTTFTLITRLQPIEIAILARLFLGDRERVGARTWWLLAVGFVGSIVLIAPASGALSDAAAGAAAAIATTSGLWALNASVMAASSQVSLRALGDTESPLAVALWFQIGTTILAIAAVIAMTGALPAVPPRHLWLALAGVGASASVGQMLLGQAYASDRAPIIAAAGYSEPMWAVLADLIVFAVWPSARTLVGGALIVGAGVALMRAPTRAAAETP